MGFVDVPVGRKVGVGEIKVEFDDRVAAITARELEGVVVEAVNADLAACVLGWCQKLDTTMLAHSPHHRWRN